MKETEFYETQIGINKSLLEIVTKMEERLDKIEDILEKLARITWMQNSTHGMYIRDQTQK